MEGPGREMASGPSAATRNEILTVTTRPFAAAANRTLSKFKPLTHLPALKVSSSCSLSIIISGHCPSRPIRAGCSAGGRAVGFEVTG